MDTELFDSNSNFASGTYTVPVSGFYLFNTSASSGQGNNTIAGMAIYKNGSVEMQTNTTVGAAGTQFPGPFVSGILQCAANDTVEPYHYANGGAGQTGKNNTFFQGILLCKT